MARSQGVTLKKSSATTPATAPATAPLPTECEPHEHARNERELGHPDEAFERAAAIFRAVGDVARLKLLARLADGEWCVSELAGAADVGLSTVSQQLRLLRSERLVVRRRDGKHMHYRLADDHVLALVQSALSHASEGQPVR